MLLMALVSAAVLIPSAFAADDPVNQAKTWFEERMSAKQSMIDQAVKDGRMTPEQAKAWTNHLEKKKQFHAENGYNCPNGGMGGCQGTN